MLTGFKVSSLTSKCGFYRPEHSANGGHLKQNFEGLLECKDEINQRPRAQRVDGKMGFLLSYHVYFQRYGY